MKEQQKGAVLAKLSTQKDFHSFWSLSDGTYLKISCISQLSNLHKSLSVFVETSLLCLRRCKVLCDNPCLFVNEYQLSFEFSSVFQNGL